MAKNKIVRRTSVKQSVAANERRRLNEIERKTQQDFPPAEQQPATTGIGAQIRRARKAQGLSWNAVAKLAGIPNSNTVRDIEYGADAKLSSVEAVAHVLGLKLEAVEA
ncbi:MAG: helix-turn-helix domain-containing protein [Planctomycetota bacterium]|nr:helix-turn-helix domain-containing protein [Planctomycetota bacterium]